MPPSLPHRKYSSRRLRLEHLEHRLTLSGASVDRGAPTHDDSVVGNFASEFTRDALTVDDRGNLRDANEQRYGSEINRALAKTGRETRANPLTYRCGEDPHGRLWARNGPGLEIKRRDRKY